MGNKEANKSGHKAMQAAEELFGEMRNSTDEENALYNAMLERLGVPFEIGDSILDIEDEPEADTKDNNRS